MRLPVCFIFLILFSCSSGSQRTNTSPGTAGAAVRTDTIPQQDDEEDVNYREAFISLYQKPVLIDTFFTDNGKKYEAIFRHFSTMDKGILVPARYNFDTNKDFLTHNFASDLTILAGKDTVFKKHITKETFRVLTDTLDMPLQEYATLLYPTLSIRNDSIQIHYSISIPVTDIGVDAYIKFDTKGNYTVGK